MSDQDKIIRDKSSFYFGLAAGVAAVSFIGLLLFLGLYLKQQLGTTGGSNEIIPVANNDNTNTAPNNNNEAPTKAANITIAKNDHVRGNKNAKVTIVEFSDIQCPFCSRFHDTMKEVMQKYPKDVRWVFKHFPLDSIHPQARKAAEAAECAGEQGKFWEYIDTLYANQSSLAADYYPTVAKQVGINVDKFNSCLSSGKMSKKVTDDFNQGQTLGVRGTPGNFINGKSVPGAVPFATI
ncbi:thioredoxin domain-containing protein, partial [Candidatus Falkowbacteria bacterium]|nr:thioredoxin domain-containing protein [Candidatus Falkowbacteria bacterium]